MSQFYFGFRSFILILGCFFSVDIYSQQLADEVSSKLNDADQKKLSKAEDLKIKGDLILSKSAYPGDKQIIEMLNMGETSALRKIVNKRDEASSFYKDANNEKFNIYRRICKEQLDKITGDQNMLESVFQSESDMVKLFLDAREKRKVLEKKSKLLERLSMLFDVEEKESRAILQLQKVIYTYMNHPSPVNKDWFTSTIEVSDQSGAKQAPNLNIDSTQVIKPVQNLISTPTVAETDTTPKVYISQLSDSAATTNQPAKIITSIQSKDKPNLASGDSSLYVLANVSEDQIDSFNSFLQNKYPSKYENYLLDFQNVDYSDMQSLRNAWYNYKYGITEDSLLLAYKDNLPAADSVAIVQNDTIKVAIAKDLAVNVPKGKSGKSGKNSAPVTSGTVSKGTLTTTATSETLEYYNRPDEPVAKGFIYRVQIAASRRKLSKHELDSLYNGSENVNEKFEDNWYKYIIGEFTTYREARKLRDRTPVKGVFVVAYLNGIRIKISPAVASNKPLKEIVDANGIVPSKIQFRVQLLASKVAMNEKYLKRLYNGPLTIDIIEEEGLIKYSLLAGNKLADALKLNEQINVTGSFIVAYYEYKKLNLNTAIKLTRKL